MLIFCKNVEKKKCVFFSSFFFLMGSRSLKGRVPRCNEKKDKRKI